MKSFQESLLRTEIDAGTRLVEVRRATNHILTGGRSRSYDKKKKTSLDQQRYLTPMFIIRDAIHAIEKVVPTRVHTLLDLGAGDAMLGSAFVKTRGVRRAISIETNPVWKRGSNSRRHTKRKGDALKCRPPAQPSRTIVGFNPRTDFVLNSPKISYARPMIRGVRTRCGYFLRS